MKFKLNSDRADSALIVFLLSIPLVLIVMGFVSDMNKNVNARIAFSTAAQESAQTAAKTVDTSGSLTTESAQAFLNEYRYHLSSSKFHTSELSNLKSETCEMVNVNGVEYKAPYIKLTLSTERGSGSSYSKSLVLQGTSNVPAGFTFNDANYKVISAEVYDTSTNNWGLFGLPDCQTHHSTVSAVVFGSNEDL